jgi:2-dehydropantoate 2-reductase
MQGTRDRIERALVVGAGAVGAAVAGLIAGRDPAAVRVLAGGERLERYRREGFVLNGTRRDFPLAPVGEKHEEQLIIVAVKAHNLARAIEDMESRVGPGTLVLSLMNGITSEDELAAAFGREKVPWGMILGIDAVRAGNDTRFSSTGRVFFGDARNTEGAWSPRVSRISDFFSRTGVAHVVPADMLRTLWYKFMINVGINQVSAIVRGAYSAFQAGGEAAAVMDAAMAEVVALSRVMGTGLEDADIPAWHATLAGFAPGNKTSMLQDVEAGRKTEVEAFAGTVLRLGKEHGVPTPVNATLYSLLRALEAGYGAAPAGAGREG